MTVVLKQILTPIDYLRIHHDSKRYFDWIFPGVLAAAFLCLYILTPNQISIAGPQGIISAVTELVKFSAGFYITALAAVATFNRPDMDEVMNNPPLLLGKGLSRRRFLCYLFGYLSFLSIVIYAVGTLSQLVAPSIGVWFNTTTIEVVQICFVAIFGLFAAQLITTTLLGLYFLTDRMVRHKPRITPVAQDNNRNHANRRAG